MPRKKNTLAVAAPLPEGADDPAAEGLDEVELEPAADGPPPPAPATAEEAEGQEPPVHSPRWTAFVLSRLGPNELWEGRPTTAGLRRVASELLGRIVENTAEPAQPPANADGRWQTVRAAVTVLWTKDVDEPEVRRFTGLADVHANNTDKAVANFPSALAETRAEGRAWRKAFQLAVCTAEEMSNVPAEEPRPDGPVDAAHKNFIEMKCQQLDIDLLKYIGRYKGAYKALDAVPYGVAQKMVAHLTEIQRDRSRIPEEIKGYDPNWES
jgi:hypothetical protein